MVTLVSMEDLKNNLSKYHNPTVVITECPFFLKAYTVHTYKIKIGPQGGATAILDNGTKTRVCLTNTNCYTEKGILDGDPAYYYSNVILPAQEYIGDALASRRKYLKETLEKYTHLMELKTKQVDALEKLLLEYPEHLL